MSIEEAINSLLDYESKNIRISITPQRWGKEWYWMVGIYKGETRSAEWVDCNNDLPKAAYPDYLTALNAAINYLKNNGKKVKV